MEFDENNSKWSNTFNIAKHKFFLTRSELTVVSSEIVSGLSSFGVESDPAKRPL